jgi:D-hexose-6-phosphate mutarotase
MPGELFFKEGPGGLPVICVNNKYASAEIALHGAHIMSYVPAGEKPVLWMSGSSYFQPDKPIRGGIPICWPWFGGHPSDKNKPSHGFARLVDWHIAEISSKQNGTLIALRLTEKGIPENFREFNFEIKLEVLVGRELQVALVIVNTGKEKISFSAALHTYFNISDIAAVTVEGLEDCKYLDTLDHIFKVQHGKISFNAETDNVYLNTEATCIIDDPGFARRIRIAKSGSRSTVVWNPWTEKSKRMPDFGDEEYHNMLCVETVNAKNDARVIAPAEKHSLKVIIGLEKKAQ